MSEDRVINLASPNMAKPKKSQLEVQMGVPSSMGFTSWDSFAQDMVVQSRSPLSIDQLTEMRRLDGQARAIVRLFTRPIMSALREAEWVEPEDGGAEEETKFANLMWTLPPHQGGMTVPLHKFMKQALLALMEGFSVFEEIRYVPKEGPLTGKICLKKLMHLDSRTVKFRTDDQGSWTGIRQITNQGGKIQDIKIDAEKIWYWANQDEENPYYGISFFETAYFHYEQKKRLYYIAHIAAQMAAVPGRIGEYPEGQADPALIQGFKNALKDFAFNTSMVHPSGFKVTPFNTSTNFDFLKLIDHHNSQMSKSVLARFLDEEARQTLIDNNRTEGDDDLFFMILESIMHDIEESLTYYVMPKYIDWNFGSKKYPEFRFGQLADSTRDVIKEFMVANVQKWTEEFALETEKKMSERLGLEIDYEEVEQRLAEDKAKAEALQQAQFGPPPDQQQDPNAGGEGGFSFGGGGGQPSDAYLSALEDSGATISMADIAHEVLRMSGGDRELEEIIHDLGMDR